jgi:RHS repeat-associated protein
VRSDTAYTYFDNGWTKSSTDPWDIATTYDYDELGSQTKRTITSAGGSSSRSQSWTYFPDGKMASRGDDGVPVGRHVVLVDNSDTQHVSTAGTWPAASSGSKFQGYDYRTNAAGTGSDTLTWRLVTPAAGTYEVFVKYPTGVSGAATNAPYTVSHSGGSTTKLVDQTVRGGEWVSLGSYSFTKGISHSVRLSDNANGTVFADAVKLVRDNSGDVDNEKKTFTYTYDENGNQKTVTDTSSGAKVDNYTMTYDGLNRLSKVEERKDGALKNTTSYTFDPNSNPLTYVHDRARGTFEYDTRGLISKVTNATSATDPNPKVTTFSYTPRAETAKITKANGNTVDLTYYLDGLVRTQVEKKSGGTVVVDHALEYTANSDLAKDTAKVMNADNHGAYLNNVYTYTYDPQDRIAKVAKTGDKPATETYFHDANSNVVEQTVGGVTTNFNYDRNRLQSASTGGVTASYNYDPFGRLDTVITGTTVAEDYTYDGFDRMTEHRTPSATTRYAFDPFDRTVQRTEKAGTANAKTTDLLYLGLDPEVIAEEVAGNVKELYAYGGVGGAGQRLSKVKTKDDGAKEDSYYSYHPLGDVEALTDKDGNTRDTYGYTAYGKDDTDQFTGADKPDPANPDKEPDNVYRFNAKRWDAAAGTYDMGFRDYDPGLNRFLTRDLYNGALGDMSLATDPYTGNRYAFGGGNPVSFVEFDGHWGFSLSDIGHAVLDVAGLVPVVGEVADVANGIWYAAEGNYVDAALSFASAIPVAGYAASAAKGAKYGAKAIDAGRTAARQGDNVADATRAVSRTGDDVADAGRAAPAPKDAPQAKPQDAPQTKPKTDTDAPSCPIKPPSSFTPDTPVLMGDGATKPISTVKVGDLVMATDPATGRTEARPVAALVTSKGDKTMVKVTVDTDGDRRNKTGTIIATDAHPFWVNDFGGWIRADNLNVGDQLRTPDGDVVEVIATRQYTQHRRVHNLTIDGIHNYYVTANGENVLVHNTGCGDATVNLRYGEDWTPQMRAAADAKVAALNRAAETQGLVRTKPQRAGRNVDRYRKAGNEIDTSEFDVDHIVDLQLGGADDVSNMSALFRGVNRSLGPQIYHQIKDLPVGTRITRVLIG